MRLPLLSICLAIVSVLCGTSVVSSQEPSSGLANATVLIIRHAEKPATGPLLSPLGIARAKKYATYFNPFRENGTALKIDALYAGADSPGSARPRMTLEPLSHSTGLPLNTHFSTNDPEALVHALSATRRGNHILIAWRHKHIPDLLKAFNGDPAKLLPEGKWPAQVFDWVILLHFDSTGHIDQERLIHEPDPLP